MPSTSMPPLTIRAWQGRDQDAAKDLILQGLGERWGWIDPTLNPDLNDIGATFATGVFLVAEIPAAEVPATEAAATLIATGAWLPEDATSVRIVRMSVRRDLRGQGIGRRLLDALLDAAWQRGMPRAVLETTSTWTDAVRFYTRYGFVITHEADGETHMVLDLRATPDHV